MLCLSASAEALAAASSAQVMGLKLQPVKTGSLGE